MTTSKNAKEELRAAWDDLLSLLAEARDAIDQPRWMPPPPHDRNLAEGYRYLMGFVHSAIERSFHSDPDRPRFHNALSTVNRGTIDNADAVYFVAAIDGRGVYRLRGHTGDTRHWVGEPPADRGPKAPHYLIFEATSGALAGDTGELTELMPGVKAQTGRIDSSQIEVDEDGSFEILFAPERPPGHTGNFVSTRKVVDRPHPTDPDVGPERFATYLSGRQLFYDWAREAPIHLEIHREGAEGTAAEPYAPALAAAELRRCGELVRNQMRFWNAFWTILMGTYGHREGTLPGVGFSRNAFNTINAASGATGGGMSTNLYAGGIAELDPGEALLVETRIGAQPQYVGFQLGNLWGESIEYADRVGSRNGFQSDVDEDGVIRWIVSHEDPGVRNWLDTSGHREVFLSPRWAYSETPARENWPTIAATKISLGEVRSHLPTSTPTFTAAQRRAEIALRQRHVQRRFRSF